MKNRNYLERLKALEISSLERRRLERNLILCYSLFHGICEIHLLLKLGVSVTVATVANLLKPAAIQMLRNIFTQIELYLRGTV